MIRRLRLVIGGLAAAAAALAWVRCGPLPEGLLDSHGVQSVLVVDRRGEVLYESRAHDGSRSLPLRADDLPRVLVGATLAAEDHRFWRHMGLDPIGLTRAIVRDIQAGAFVEGGSTITQQVAKLLLNRDAPDRRRRGAFGKAHEALIALRLEHRFTKREILALYLNLAAYGNQLTGVERASREYFGRSAATLTAAEAAYLAALPQRPSTFNPYRSPAAARQRQRHILNRMVRLGFLPPETLAQALDEALSLRREPAAFVAPHFVERVLAANPGSPGRMETTLDAELQRDVQGIIRSHRRALERHGARNVAVAVLDNVSGEWLAWEGSGNYHDRAHGGAIDGVVTPRQPGSALKPFTYALAFETGDSPATVLPDVPSYFPTGEDGVLYQPRNYDGHFRGPLRARVALAGSQNVPAVALAARVGVPDLLRFLRKAGFSTFDKTAAHYGLGATLGDGEVRLDQLVAAYAAFARGGLPLAPRFTRAAGDSVAAGTSSEPLVSARTAFWISDILADSRARAYAFGRDSSLDFPFPVAAKTGTSQAYRDNWAIGYTRERTVGVWVGNFDRTPLVGSSGVTGAGPIFHAVMMAAVERSAREPGVVRSPSVTEPVASGRRAVCALSGFDAGPSCPSHLDEWLPVESPARTCDWHQPGPAGTAVVAWPTEYRGWAREQGLEGLPPRQATALRAADSRRQRLQILSPPEGATYLIDPTLRSQFQTLGLRATSDNGGRVEWFVNGRIAGSSASDERFDWPLEPGAHLIAARDGRGHSAEVSIVVK